MPARERRPRRKMRTSQNAERDNMQELQEQARIATPEDWNSGLRRRYIRALVAHGLKEDDAVKVAGAYERKPQFIPGPTPKHIQDKMRELGKIK